MIAAVVVVAVAAITDASGGSAAVVFASAGIGALASGVTSTITQLSSGNGFSFSQLLVDSSFGAITGAIEGSTFNLVGVAVENSITNFASSITSNWVEGKSIDWGNAGLSALVGLISGLMSGAGVQNGLTGHTKQLINSRKLIKSNFENYSSRGGKGALNLMKYHIKNSRHIVRNIGLFNLKMGYADTINIIGFDVLIAKLLNP